MVSSLQFKLKDGNLLGPEISASYLCFDVRGAASTLSANSNIKIDSAVLHDIVHTSLLSLRI